jgi:hypothetical protein
MGTVSAESAMIAVVHHDDISAGPARACDARQPRDQPFGRLRFPVPADFRPHHHAAYSRAANFFAQQRTAIAVGRPHPAGRLRVKGCGNGVLAAREFVADARARAKNQIGMGVRVISD